MEKKEIKDGTGWHQLRKMRLMSHRLKSHLPSCTYSKTLFSDKNSDKKEQKSGVYTTNFCSLNIKSVCI